MHVADNKSNEMEVYLYFKLNVPKSLPDNVKFLLETAFSVQECGISCVETGGQENLEIIWKLYDVLREHFLSKTFDSNKWDCRIQIVSRILLLALIRAVGCSYSEL